VKKKCQEELSGEAVRTIEVVYYIVKANPLLLLPARESPSGWAPGLIVKKRNDYARLAGTGSLLGFLPPPNYFKENGRLKIS